MAPQTSTRLVKRGNEMVQEEEIIGKWVTAAEVMERIIKDRVFYDESNGGVTFSGGEPLLQFEFLSDLVNRCQARDIHTALDTCGYADWEHFSRLIDRVDLFLYDIKLIDPKAHQKYTGLSNEKILANLRRLSEEKKKIIIRFVVVPGITDTRENLAGIRQYLASLPGVEEIDILPYHRMGVHKLKKLKLNELRDFKIPSQTHLKKVREAFSPLGIKIKTGG